jgi:protein-disulfide isomerase
MLTLDRRTFLASCAVGALVVGFGSVLLAPGEALAQAAPDLSELHSPGQLGDKVLGPADAKVTVVEYASMSCPHCAHFANTTFPEFKLKYIDSGKVRYIFREFPLNAPAYAVAMLARCAPADRYFEVVDSYFRTQDEWLRADDVRQAIVDAAKPFGFDDKSFEACISNQALFTGLDAVKNRGAAFGVQATPTFFINGKKFEGALTIAELQKEIDPLL